jgi:hypothetical protein
MSKMDPSTGGRMTTKPKPRKAPATKASKPRVITDKQAAEMDFEPWPGDVNLKALPTNDQFIEDGIPHLVACRLALASMYKTKAQMMEMLEEDGDIMGDVLKRLQSAHDFFSLFSKLLTMAECRYVAAGSKVLRRLMVRAERLSRPE